jgi:hypothetical protein
MGSNPSQAPVNSMEDRAAEATALYARFQEFAILADPLESPFARQLAADGHQISAIPLSPHRSQTAFLGVRLVWRNLELHLRQPDDSSLLICNIHRSGSNESLAGPLLSLGSFLRYAVHRSELIEVIGGCVSKAEEASEGDLPLPRLRDFYTRLVGDLHEYRDIDMAWLFGITRRPSRYSEQKIWQRR